jgi:adenosylcobyric acid synthase
VRPLMVQGCTSWAGKSLLTTVLCRWASDLGLDVAPFKAQNMANNARVTPDGEIGVAQWLQARAARVAPHVDHNPVLLKPEADTRSQVVVLGHVDAELTATPWRERRDRLWEVVAAAADRLRARHDLLVVEGAGSPAEINLPDVVNGAVAAHLDAAVLLVADIDRGGAFAHLYGTWALVDDDARRRLAGFVLNRFRGDPALLDPGPTLLAERTGVPTLGLVPMLRHGLPDEDGARGWPAPAGAGPHPRVAVVSAPAASNLDELAGVAQVAELVWARRPADLAGADLVVLPGSKHVAHDRRWLADTGLDRAVVAAAGAGTRVLGTCGGAMLLGRRVVDEAGLEGGSPSDVAGLGLLDLTTRYAPEKLLRTGPLAFGEALPSAWAALAGRTVADTYEIRLGRVTGPADRVAATGAGGEPLAWADGPVLATTAHGLLEDPDLVAALLGTSRPPALDDVLDELTAVVVPHLDTDAILTSIGA